MFKLQSRGVVMSRKFTAEIRLAIAGLKVVHGDFFSSNVGNKYIKLVLHVW